MEGKGADDGRKKKDDGLGGRGLRVLTSHISYLTSQYNPVQEKVSTRRYHSQRQQNVEIGMNEGRSMKVRRK
jgi:hypothetical protein